MLVMLCSPTERNNQRGPIVCLRPTSDLHSIAGKMMCAEPVSKTTRKSWGIGCTGWGSHWIDFKGKLKPENHGKPP